MIHGLMVIKNEEDRYLEACLKWNRQHFDTLSVVDDSSTDRSAEIAERYADHVVTGLRGLKFLDNEGRFRESAWEWWVYSALSPSREDWFVSVDADEFITGDLREAIEDHPGTSASFRVREVWGVDPVVVRVDGYWNRGVSPRCLKGERLLDGFKFLHKTLGSGSLPHGFAGSSPLHGSELLHFGYAKPRDRQVKYDRYRGDRNHGPHHIESIKRNPQVTEWTGQVVDFE